MARDSFNILLWVRAIWSAENSLSAPERAVLTVLARHADASGECFPGLGTIASESGLSRRTVIGCIKNLETRGVFRHDKRSRGNGFASNLYRLSGAPPQLSVAPLTSAPVALPSSAGAALGNVEGSAGDSPPVVQELHSGSAGAAHEVTHELPSLTTQPRTSAIEVPKFSPSKRAKSPKAVPKKAPHPHSSELKDFYFSEMDRCRGIKATFAPKQWSRAMASFGELFDSVGSVAEARVIITNALTNEFAHRVQPWELVTDINKHRVPPKPSSSRKPTPQRGMGPGVKIATVDDTTWSQEAAQ